MYNYEKKLSLEETGLFAIMMDMPVIKLVSPEFLAKESDTDIKKINELLDGLLEKDYVTCINGRYTVKSENLAKILYGDDSIEDTFAYDDYELDTSDGVSVENMSLSEFLHHVADNIENK